MIKDLDQMVRVLDELFKSAARIGRSKDEQEHVFLDTRKVTKKGNKISNEIMEIVSGGIKNQDGRSTG